MTASSIGSPTTALCRLVAYAGLTLALMPLQLIAVAFRWPLRKTLPRWYHRRTCRILGIQIERRGRPSRRHPTLFVANHVSYLDIEVERESAARYGLTVGDVQDIITSAVGGVNVPSTGARIWSPRSISSRLGLKSTVASIVP